MIEYRCPDCGIKTSFSSCPVCGIRTKITHTVYYCPTCNVPVWEDVCPICSGKAYYIATDIRPVFPQERLLFEVLRREPMKYRDSSVWYGSGLYFVDGKAARLSSKEWGQVNPNALSASLQQYADENKQNAFERYASLWVKANKARYDDIVAEAMHAVQKAAQDTPISEMFVSFSGGKDSTVTSSIVMRALGTPSIIHLYGNTTLEFPETLRYMERFKADNRKTPMLVAQNTEKNFFDMCDVIGPPSRVKRWCCIVFKTGAITRKIEKTFPGVRRLLTFYGIRRSESNNRSKYDRETESPKISKQVVFSPIIDWLDYDVWLYLLTTGIDFNDAYRLGYTRVGCWCCPNNSRWSEFLSRIYMPQQYADWHDQLVRFAQKVGKPDPVIYVDEGGWKARQGGNGLAVSERFSIGFTPCATEENVFNYELARPISDDLYELFKPFGTLDFDIGNKRINEVYVLSLSGDPILKLQGRIGKTVLRVSILKLPFAGCKRIHEAELKIKCQLAKYQICLGCMACTSVCKHDAIRITPSEDWFSYTIDERRCIHCGKCVNHFDGGCYMRDVIRTKNGSDSSVRAKASI